MKRYFKITATGHGGEVVIGRASASFVEDFAGDSDAIIDNVEDIADDWNEVDDIDHVTGAGADAALHVTEVDEDGNEIATVGYATTNILYGREAGLFPKLPPNGVSNFIPVVSIFAEEQGTFFTAIVETSGEDFNEDLLKVGVAEFNLCDIIEQMWYDGAIIELDTDCYDTMGVNKTACVGAINLEWRESFEKYLDTDVIAELLECS